jgi:hypothetical protein
LWQATENNRAAGTMTAKTKQKRQGTVCLTSGKRTTLKRN